MFVLVRLAFFKVAGVPQLEGKALDGRIALIYLPQTAHWEAAVEGMRQFVKTHAQKSPELFRARFAVSEQSEVGYGVADVCADSALHETCRAIVNAGLEKVPVPLARARIRTQTEFQAVFRMWSGDGRAVDAGFSASPADAVDELNAGGARAARPESLPAADVLSSALAAEDETGWLPTCF